MINIAYINNGCVDSLFCDENSTFGRYLESCIDEIDGEYNNLISSTRSIMLESEIMDEIDENTRLFIEKEADNFISKIGQKIIDIAQKFIEMVKKLIQKVKDLTFRFKSNEKKMDRLLKEHPELGKEKIKILCENGNLDFKDFKSIAELDEAFEKVCKLAAKGEPVSTIEKTWDTLTNKILSTENIRKASSIIKLATAIKEFKTKSVKAKNDYDKAIDERAKRRAKNWEMVRKNISDASVGKLIVSYYGLITKQDSDILNHNHSILNTLAKAIDAFCNNKITKAVIGDSTKRLNQRIDAITDYTKDRDEENQERKKDKTESKTD